MEINPQSVILPDNPNSSIHNIRVEVDWDAQEEQANGHFWNANLQVNTQLSDNCEQEVGATGFIYGWPTGSSILNIQNANAYYYTFRVTLTGFYGAYQSVDVNYRFYFDDELLQSGLIEAMSGTDYTWTVTRYYEKTIYVFLVDFLDFRINTYNYPVEYKSNYDLNINPGNSCSSTNVVSLTDIVNLSIIQGSQYLTFFQNQTEDTLGSSTQTILSDLDNIKLVYNKPLRDSLDTLGVIEIEGNGLVEYDTVIIKPALYDLIVETDPEIIAPGDTAIVTVKRRTDYGIQEFNQDQSFDVWIVEGSNYGFLLDSLTGNSGSSLTDAVNRFRIVANDSVDVDSTKIVVRVITETGNVSTRLTKNNVSNNDEVKIENSNLNDKEKEPVQTDWIVFGETLEGFGDVVVGNECDCKEWECNGEVKRPRIDVLEINLGNGSQREKDYIISSCNSVTRPKCGFFNPVFEGPFWDPTPSAEPCYNCNQKNWQLKYDNDTIYVRAYTVFCKDCEEESGIIRTLNDIWNKIPEEKLCKALADFKEQKKYRHSEIDYLIEPAVMKHERLHKNDLFSALAKALYYYPIKNEKKFNSTLLNTNYTCQDLNNIELIEDTARKYLQNQFDEFKSTIKKLFEDITGKDDTPEREKYETDLHRRIEVQKIIKDYIDEVKKRIDEINKNKPKKDKIICN